jgi:NADPH:quinone reductase-like Zn-dependent oxidoreductase
VLVRVRAASLNPYDWHFMKGIPYIMRLEAGLRRPKDIRVGVDFSGVVEAVGKNVTRFQSGDAVFGGKSGALAEYITVSEKNLASKPENISFEEAGGVRIAALTALQAVRDHGKIKPGTKVLINGASGGVGTFAVQIAKHFGANVTGVSSGRNTELVRSLGADQTIDYTKEDYTQSGQQWDVIIDNVGSHSLLANRRALTPNGIYVMVGGPKGNWLAPIDRVFKMMLMSPFIDQHFGMMLAKANPEDTNLLRELLQSGKVKTVIDKTYQGLEQAPEAMRYLDTGRARGKIVVVVSPATSSEAQKATH